LRDMAGRRRAVIVALSATLFVALVLPEQLFARDPKGLGRFMQAVAQVESGGRYDARNSHTRAHGKYQIMPASWKAWAKLYLGDAGARRTPRNQERVAHAKFKALKRWLGGWQYVAHWWLTGSGDKTSSHWSASSRRYVRRVMAIYHDPRHASTASALGDGSPQIGYRGGWSTARFGSYSGDTVRYATRSGARASVTLSGKSVSWIGPKGPTRGRAKVYIDGKLARIVNLRAGAFDARSVLFTKGWARAGTHRLTIVVTGNRGPVAIDDLRVG
jgi:hypothetical protein